MRKELITLLCVVGLLLWGIGLANAQTTVTWTMLEHSSVAGHSPGADARVGTGDDGTNNCNFLPLTSPCGTGSPTIGSYSVNRVDFKPDPREECFKGAVTGGTPCKCADGVNQCDPGPETCPPVSSGCGETPGNCCGPLDCQICDDVSDSFFGSGGAHGTGTMKMCNDSTGFDTILFDVATTETLPGTGGGCLDLYTPGDDSGTPCPNYNAATSISGTIDVAVGAMGLCPAGGIFQVNNISYTGNVFPALSPPGSVCGYSSTSLTNLRNAAIAASGVSNPRIIVLCGTTTLPGSGGISSLPCYSNAQVQFTTVAWTTDSWTCTGTCP